MMRDEALNIVSQCMEDVQVTAGDAEKTKGSERLELMTLTVSYQLNAVIALLSALVTYLPKEPPQ